MSPARIVRWIGRITSVVLALALAALSIKIFSSEKHISRGSWFDLLFLSFLIPGLVISVINEKAGIILVGSGVLGFVVYDAVVFELRPSTFVFLLLAIPSLLVLVARLMEEDKHHGV